MSKDLYGINEAKIQAYSPSEAQKIYERPVNRKANARFNPAATVEIIRMGEPVAANLLDEEGRRDLVAKYLGVSHPKKCSDGQKQCC
jgi:cohesin loading factor subunit SCC2